jgi:hypothetical protein
LPVGDYAVEADGEIVAVVERKSVEDLVSTIVGGKLWTLLAAMAGVPHAALVVDDRYSSLFKLAHVRPATVAEQIAEAAVRYPAVPIVFAETRQLAQDYQESYPPSVRRVIRGSRVASASAGRRIPSSDRSKATHQGYSTPGFSSPNDT